MANRLKKGNPSPLPSTIPELARKCFEISKQNLMLLQRLVELEELHLQTRLFVQQGQTFICALAKAAHIHPDFFAEEIAAANNNDRKYEQDLTAALNKIRDQKAKEAAHKAQNIKDIV